MTEETYDLIQFYKEKLHFAVVQVSGKLNKLPNNTLKRLYEEMCSI